MRRIVFTTLAGMLGLMLLSACNNHWKALEEGFQTPPDSIRMAVYWYWLDNHISKEGVVKDLEAMKRVGITRAFIGNQAEGDADGPVPLFSDEWWDVTHTAMKKAGELGIEIGMFNCPGWSQSGGPWVSPEQSMKYVEGHFQEVTGNGSEQLLELPEVTPDRIIAVQAWMSVKGDSRTWTLQTRKGVPAVLKMPVPFTVRSLVLKSDGEQWTPARLSLDGKDVAAFTYDRHNLGLNVGFKPLAPWVENLVETPAGTYELHLDDPSDGTFTVTLSEVAYMPRYAEKTLAKMFQEPLPLWDTYLWDTPQYVNFRYCVDDYTLQDLTGLEPTNIPLDDPEVMSLFSSTKALGITPEQNGGIDVGSLGIPEFGTKFVIGMLDDTRPSTMSELVRISGLSHGTDVWLGNAQALIQQGTATLSTAICTRDDIMSYLIGMNMDKSLSFKTMESVRKGKGLTPQMKEAMVAAGVPDWYIQSCLKIKYMFPKAHAAAYVMMALRIAYCKVHYPLAYYAAYYSIGASAFSYEIMCQGQAHLLEMMEDYNKRKDSLTPKELATLDDCLVVREMYARGIEFTPIDIFTAGSRTCKIVDGKIMPALTSIDGMGEKAADAVVEAVKDGPFISRDDFWNRTKVPKTVVEKMNAMGAADLTDTGEEAAEEEALEPAA